MATADELLKNVAIQPNPEGHIVVGGDRFVTVPDNLKRLGVQYDHNMETVVFDCPRHWDNHDMSKMAVYVNYIRSDGYADRYPVDNLRADNDIMHFDWTISRNVTEVAGGISFIVCVMKTDAEGNEERHWNSELCQDCYISKGMETEEHPALDYPDEVTQLLLRMSTVEQINVQANEMQALYDATVETANTAEEIKNQALDASGYIKNSYASVIKSNMSGKAARVDDVSPIEHDVKCWVHGKNLIVRPYAESNVTERDGVTWSIDQTDGGIVVNGTPTKNTSYNVAYNYQHTIALKKGRTYTLTDISSFTGATGYVYLQNMSNGVVKNSATVRNESKTFLVESDGYANIGIVLLGGVTYKNEKILLQLEESSVPTAYEPYIDPTTITAYSCGKNLARSSYKYDVTQNGINIAATKDSAEIILNGTSTKASSYRIMKDILLPPGTYTASVIGANTVDSASDRLYVFNPDTNTVIKNYIMTDKPQTFTITEPTLVAVEMVFAEGSKYSYKTIRVQIELGETATEYESYKVVSSCIPDSDGTCVVTSKSPTMTLFTDTAGAIVEAEYNADTKTWIENYIRDNFVISPGGEGGSVSWLTNVSIPASGWVTESTSLHSQVIKIAGTTKYSKVDLLPSVEQLAIFFEKNVSFVTENENGVITVYAIGDKPLLSYTMQVQITEVIV